MEEVSSSSNKRRSGRGRGGSSVVVAVGSVWESRMKSDEVRGGIKVFNAEEEEGIGRLKRSPIVGVAASGGKRKTWKSDKNSDDGIKKRPIQTRKVGASADKSERRSIIHTRKLRSEKEGGESGEGKLLKSKSDSVKKNDSDSGSADSLIQLRKTNSASDYVSDESRNVIDVSDGSGCEMVVEDENKKNDCDENCKDLEVCQEKVISSSSDNVSVVNDEGDEEEEVEEEMDEEEEVEEEMDEEEIEIEMETIDVKEITIPESNSKVVVKELENKKIVVNEPEKKVVVSEPEKKKVVIDEQEKKKKVLNESEPKKIVSANMRFHHRNEKPVSVPIAVKQSSPIKRHSTIYQNFSKANSSKIF